MMFLLRMGAFLSDDNPIRATLRDYLIEKEEGEEDLDFRKRVFFSIWGIYDDLTTAVEFLFGPYKLGEEWVNLPNQKDKAEKILTEIEQYKIDNEQNILIVKNIINEYLPQDPLLAHR